MTVDLGRDALFVTLAGSQAHGTARVGSDVDLRGVFIAPLELRLSLFRTLDQIEAPIEGQLGEEVNMRLRRHPTAALGMDLKTESVLFDIAKFLSLCAAANPNALEILFADERDWMYETPAWRRLHMERHRFLSMKVRQTYLGYAMAQLKRIGTHRSWLLNPPAQKPRRSDFGLPEASTLSRDDQDRIERNIGDRLRTYSIDSIEMPPTTRIEVKERLRLLHQDLLQTAEASLQERLRSVAVSSLRLPREVEATLEAERRYRSAMKHWSAFQTWKASRNPARAELERRHGYDTKHAMHLIRLMRSGLEILQTGELRVRRGDAEDLNAVRDGALSFEALLEAASRLQSEIEETAHRTALPADVDEAFVDGLLLELVRGAR
jgi:predicted nucleotidyltransferase